jgi:hypothetical protein
MLFSQELIEENNIEQNKTYKEPELKIDFPIFSLPYQIDTMNSMGYGFFNTYSSLSMNQSIAVTMDVYSAMHYGLKKLNDSLDIPNIWKNIIYYSGTAAGILAFAYILPFGYPWMQEEYTRSILSYYGVNSLNGVYSLPGQAVTGFTDSALADFKAKAPYDFIRMNTAGMESYILFSDLMTRKYFFYDLDDLSFVPALITVLLNLGHAGAGFAQEGGFQNLDNNIKTMYKNDKGQTERAIAGFNTFNWVYELFRPDEPYTDRGQHPSGDGSAARYITYSQLTDAERQYLVKQGYLSYLNFVSPLLYGFKALPFGDLKANFALRHYFTPFGTDICASVFLKKNHLNMIFTYHNYQNYENYFPALEAEMVDYPLNIGNLKMFFSPRLLIGMQPEGQEFKTASPEFLGLFGLRVDFMANNHIFPYIDFTAKTNGWIAGNEYLNANAGVHLGVSLRY